MVEVRCTRCDGRNIKYIKKWYMISGRSKNELEIKLYYCRDCRKSFREINKI